VSITGLVCAVKNIRGKVKQLATATDKVESVLKERETELFESPAGGEPALKEA